MSARAQSKIVEHPAAKQKRRELYLVWPEMEPDPDGGCDGSDYAVHIECHICVADFHKRCISVCKTLAENELDSFAGVGKGTPCLMGNPRGATCLENVNQSAVLTEKQGHGTHNVSPIRQVAESWEMAWRNFMALDPQADRLRGYVANNGYVFLGRTKALEEIGYSHEPNINQDSLDNQESILLVHKYIEILDSMEVMKKTTAEIVGDRLRALRKHKKVSQRALCEATGISTAAYNNYEKGKNRPDVDNIVKLAAYHGCSCDFIMTGNLAYIPYTLAKALEEAQEEQQDTA